MFIWLIAGLVVLGCEPAQAATLDGARLAWPWALPFAGILLSIALGPLLTPKFWHRHYGKVAFAWLLATLIPLAAAFGADVAVAAFVHAMVAEYMSFIILLFALYVCAGGILITGNLGGTPALNTAVLAFGTAIASLIGTTGAALVLIRPLIRANAGRRHSAHVVIFFIILVANIGGALSPLGDPPLFVGFLRGVSFFWPAQHLWLQTLLVAVIILAIFFVFDLLRARGDRQTQTTDSTVKVRGLSNILLIALIVGSILLSGAWKTGIRFDIYGTPLALESLLRDLFLIVIALISLAVTREEHHDANNFSFEPIREVAILFAGIFGAMIPVAAMLQAGSEGAFAFLLEAVTTKSGAPNEAAYFWLTGILSAFLDNAPTYLVFFELAGGDASQLMGPLAGTLAAISMGAVYMGALTYIGNAPNLMVSAIATEQGVRMPSFFGYFVWAACILVPLFVLLTLLPISPILSRH